MKALQLEPLVNDHLGPPISDRDYFLCLTVNDFALVLTSCKRPQLTHSLISRFAVSTMLLTIYKEL